MNSPHPILDLGLKNQFRHDLRHHRNRYTLFCDAFSCFGSGFPSQAPLGIGPICPRATLSTYEIANPALQLWLQEAAFSVPLQRQELECFPWLTLEKAILPTSDGCLHVEVAHVFRDAGSMISQFTFVNGGSSGLPLDPRWKGRISEDRELYMLPYFIGKSSAFPRARFLDAVDRGIIGGLRRTEATHTLPLVEIRLRACGDALTTTIDLDGGYEFALAAPGYLESGASLAYQFLIEIHMGNTHSFQDRVKPVETDFSDLIGMARTRFADAIAIDSPPPIKEPALSLKTWRARHALLRNGMRGDGGEFGDEIACLCTADNTDFSCVFFWDSLFSSVAISRFHREYAKGAIRTAFVRMEERDGSTPERKYNHCANGRMAQQSPQSPVAAWAVREFLNRHEDLEFLAEIYPLLVRNHSFWEVFSDCDRDGLAEYRWTGQVADNSPLWDHYTDREGLSGCAWIPPIASVALNSFLFWDANHMVELAGRLGRVEDVARFRRRADQLERDLLGICYLPAERRFWDYDHHIRQHSRVKTFYMFWPLVAGIAIPADAEKDLIENVLLDPSQFFGDVPFPSVAYDEKTYDSTGYWRGRVWPHITFWLLRMLVQKGYVNEAETAARRTLVAYGRSSGFPENFASRVRDFDETGFLDYNWGCAAFYLIATGEYRVD